MLGVGKMASLPPAPVNKTLAGSGVDAALLVPESANLPCTPSAVDIPRTSVNSGTSEASSYAVGGAPRSSCSLPVGPEAPRPSHDRRQLPSARPNDAEADAGPRRPTTAAADTRRRRASVRVLSAPTQRRTPATPISPTARSGQVHGRVQSAPSSRSSWHSEVLSEQHAAALATATPFSVPAWVDDVSTATAAAAVDHTDADSDSAGVSVMRLQSLRTALSPLDGSSSFNYDFMPDSQPLPPARVGTPSRPKTKKKKSTKLPKNPGKIGVTRKRSSNLVIPKLPSTSHSAARSLYATANARLQSRPQKPPHASTSSTTRASPRKCAPKRRARPPALPKQQPGSPRLPKRRARPPTKPKQPGVPLSARSSSCSVVSIGFGRQSASTPRASNAFL